MLIYAEVKLVCDKIDVLLRNLNKNTKPGWEISLEGQERKLPQHGKVQRKKKHMDILTWKNQIKTTNKSENATWRDKSKDMWKKGDLKIPRQGRVIQIQQDFQK